ncbi:MAG: choline-sulfatase [Pseudohongiellaceae bacterium]
MRHLGGAALLATALLWLIPGCGEAAPKPALRVVLITLDTLRYDRFAGPGAVMPRLAASAQSGTVFSRAYSATSSTQPSHASMFTGAHPWQHGVSRNGQILPENALTVTELFSFAGFSTAAAVASFPMEGRFGFARGFDHYLDDFALGRPQKKTWGGHAPDWKHFYSAADTVTDEALALIDKSTGSRQFFFFHYFDAHSPYGDSAVPSEVVETRELTAVAKQNNSELPAALARAEAAYDRDIEFLDQRIAQLLERLATDAEHIETHIIITADHGESFGDDGSFGHGDRVTEAQLHVPLIILSQKVSPGVRGDPAGSIDMARTLLALGGLDPHLVTGGRNLCPEPSGRTPRLVGMRRTYGEPARDVRITGEVVSLTGLRFYQLRDNGLIVGDSEALEGTDITLADHDSSALRELFGAFEQTLLSSDAEEQLDEQTRAALDALGYTR